MNENAMVVETQYLFPVVHFSGDIDIDQVPRLRMALDTLIDDTATDLVLDLSAVDYIDSTGLGLLVAVHKKLAGIKARYVLLVPHASQKKVFEITGLTTVLTLVDSLEEALEILGTV